MNYIDKIKERQEISNLDTLPIGFVLDILADIDQRVERAMDETKEYYDVKSTMSILEDLRDMLSMEEKEN